MLFGKGIKVVQRQAHRKLDPIFGKPNSRALIERDKRKAAELAYLGYQHTDLLAQ